MITMMELDCAAKVNLSLDVTGKRPDGYHTLESIFQTVSVYDTIELYRADVSPSGDVLTLPGMQSITLECNKKSVPCDETNLAWKAAKAIMDASGKQVPVHIRLTKHIPSGAGMGGGSADAAGVLYGLNQMLECGFSDEKLREIGLTLGADVPFLLMGGTAYAEGVGEILIPLQPLPELHMVIVKGKKSISTPEAYKAIDALTDPVHPDTARMRQAVETQDIPMLCEYCENLFEEAVMCEDVFRAKQRLMDCGAQCAVMTGSGAAVFGIFPDYASAAACSNQLKDEFAFVQDCRTVKKSIEKGYSNTVTTKGDCL